MNITKNIKFVAISVISIGTLYLGYLQFQKFQRRLTRLERDVRVIKSNIEDKRQAEHFVETKPERQVVLDTPTEVVEPVVKNILTNISIEDNIESMLERATTDEQLDKLEAELEDDYAQFSTDDSDYETVTEDEDDVDVDVDVEVNDDTEVLETIEETVETVEDIVDEPLKEIHILNQYIHLNDQELHTVFSKNTCAELRDLLKKCSLSSGGKKEVLIQRLINHKKSITSISSNE